ncbi:hypothetical protein LPJ75_005848, partial [Coemansia sp. RSA 2598]
MHILPALPMAIPLPSSGLSSSKSKINATSTRAYPPNNASLSIVTGRHLESPANSFTAVNSPNFKTQPKHSSSQHQQQQQHRYSPQPHATHQHQHQHQYEQNKLIKRMQHLSFPLTGSSSLPKSMTHTSDRYRHPSQTHWRPERSSTHGLNTSPEYDGQGGSGSSSENYQLYPSQSYQHAPASKTQPQNIFTQSLRHSLQQGYHRRTPSQGQGQGQSQYQGQHHHQQQQQPHHQHQYHYQPSPRHNSSHYDQTPSASRTANPRLSHLHSGHQHHTGTHAAAAAALNGSLPMSMPVVSMLSSKNTDYTKKPRQKKCVTFADPIAEFQELPSVCSMSAPTSSFLSSASILKKSSLTRSTIADDYGSGSGSNGGLLAYEQNKASGGFRSSESRRGRSSSQPTRYSAFDSFYALDDPAYLADYERPSYWNSYDDGHVCNDASCSGYKYD